MFDGGKQRKKKKKFAKGMKKYFSLYANASPSLGVLANTQARYSADLRAAFFFLGTLVFMSVFWEFYRCSCQFKCLVSVGYRYLLEESSIICFLFIYLFCCGGNNISLEYRLALNYYLLLNLILSIINKYF